MFDISIDREKGIIYLEYNEFLTEIKETQEFLRDMIDSLTEKKFSVLMNYFDVKVIDMQNIEQLKELIDYLLERGMSILAIVSAYNECLSQMSYLLRPIKKQNKRIKVCYYKRWERAKECLENEK